MTRKKETITTRTRTRPLMYAPREPVVRRMILTFEVESKASCEATLKQAHTALIVNDVKPKSMGVVLCAPTALKAGAKERLIELINEIAAEGT